MTAIMITIGIVAVLIILGYLDTKAYGWERKDNGDVYDRKGRYIDNWPAHGN